MDLGALLDTCNWCDKWQFSADLFHSNISLAPLQDIRLQTLNDLEFDLSMSYVMMSLDSPTYAFLLMFISNLWPNSAPSQDSNIWPNSSPLQDKRLQNLSDLEFDLSRSLKVKCDDVIGLVIIRGYLLICTAITCLTLTV